MSVDTIIGYGQTFLNTQWTYFWGYSASKTFYLADGTQAYIGPTDFLGYGGAAFAFLISLLGASETAGQTLVSIEGSLDVWLGGFDDGNYDKIMKNAEKSDAM